MGFIKDFVTDAVTDAVGGVVKYVASGIDTVLGVFNQQQNIIEQMVQAPLRAMISEVTGGIWTGAGADAFVQELTSDFVPGTQSIFGSIGNVIKSVTNAAESIGSADGSASKQVTGWIEDIVSSIF
jgi:hypothetical protein